MMTHDFEVVFEAENYMFLNYRNQSSYTTGMNGAAWEVVTNLEYTNIIDKGLRCWPNVGRSISSGSIAGPAVRYDVAFRAANQNYRAYARGTTCNGCTSDPHTAISAIPLSTTILWDVWLGSQFYSCKQDIWFSCWK